MATVPSSGLVRFGVFEIDLASGELRKQGVRIKLHEQPFKVLVMLVERQGQVVSREETLSAPMARGCLPGF
jgi:DNA-binding winged helix-turn-helix (wHTH) protein